MIKQTFVKSFLLPFKQRWTILSHEYLQNVGSQVSAYMHIQSCRCPVCSGIGTAKHTQAIPQCGSLVVSSNVQRTLTSRRKNARKLGFSWPPRCFLLVRVRAKQKHLRRLRATFRSRGDLLVPYCTLQNCEANISCKLKGWPRLVHPVIQMTKQPVDFCQVAIVQRTLLLGNGSKVTSTSRKGPIRASSKIWSSQITPFTAVSPLWESGLVPFARISSSSALHLSLTSSWPIETSQGSTTSTCTAFPGVPLARRAATAEVAAARARLRRRLSSLRFHGFCLEMLGDNNLAIGILYMIYMIYIYMNIYIWIYEYIYIWIYEYIYIYEYMNIYIYIIHSAAASHKNCTYKYIYIYIYIYIVNNNII